MNEQILTELLTKAKLALRITTETFDQEIKDILQAGCEDLETRGVTVINNGSVSFLATRALLTYVRYHFGDPENPEKLKASYDEQKAQLMTTTDYTNWGEDDNGQE